MIALPGKVVSLEGVSFDWSCLKSRAIFHYEARSIYVDVDVAHLRYTFGCLETVWSKFLILFYFHAIILY